MKILLLSWLLSGWLTYYASGVMEQVYANRLLWGHVQPCPACVGLAAAIDREMVGKYVALRGPEGWEGPFLVVDCAMMQHVANLRERGIIGEVDYPTAKRWQMRGPVRGEMLLWEDYEALVDVQFPR